VTIDSLAGGLGRPSRPVFRVAVIACAILLGVQCIWLILPELFRSRIDRLPTDPPAAAAAAKDRAAALRAATVGGIRGDLWAEAAFTEASLLWNGKQETPDASLGRARASLDRSLRDAPHRSDIWLFLAGLAARFPSRELNAIEPLKMSYYTGPSDQSLAPLRLKIAIQSESFSDDEMRQLISRDIRVLISQKQISTIAGILKTATSNARLFLQETIRDIEPSALDTIAGSAEKPSQLQH
jgi:hypothetical protein